MGWKITISPSVESENNEYDIDADNWAGDHINIAMEEPGEDMVKLKAFADTRDVSAAYHTSRSRHPHQCR